MILHHHGMKHFAVGDRRVHLARLASFVIEGLERFTMDWWITCDVCCHRSGYPPPIGVFSLILVPTFPQPSSYVNLGGLLNDALLHQPLPAHTRKTDVRNAECQQCATKEKMPFK